MPWFRQSSSEEPPVRRPPYQTSVSVRWLSYVCLDSLQRELQDVTAIDSDALRASRLRDRLHAKFALPLDIEDPTQFEVAQVRADTIGTHLRDHVFFGERLPRIYLG